MRVVLKAREGIRGQYRGTVIRFGSKRAFRGPNLQTLLLSPISDASGEVVADHLWLTVGVQLARLNLTTGQVVSFDARVTPYIKGYQGYRDDVLDSPIEEDYRLSNPTKFALVTDGAESAHRLGPG